ncbi:2-oxo-4-hydroxy-4-carboxy-5-ureidoimidazoline decarboxylase [Quadrisphaera oryzae]|uniref:2-oxo-4-hydroxy-4-carboxy-5-ureidoimidazoline decarboxylase n=1 Tax=Quadrisphaera TaxID=317661 RepID=UPI001645D138|nr:2-oxo-4-hydroxy-4-carboxy-5-ureidoimidazoline decarboxylase [Quadrisphaera sp. RL12-1S]MBC3762262.1 2-oxo-4-hydroxy-4-carboxy-5-ureidoimidazoline decarboxylase [Quadrisphaera sp. RL12-1S]
MPLIDVLLGRTPPSGSEAQALAACLDAPLWVASVLDGAPYPDVEALLEQADAAARALPPEAVLAALQTHPRIGERPTGDSAHERMSRLEQSGVSRDAETTERLAAGNAAYEARFGHVFLVRAAGLSSEEVLAALEARLANDAAAELEVAGDQLRQIALLRLQAALTA